MDTKYQAPTKLTKAALMGLDRGLWISSNCWNGAGYPIYAARVAPMKDREAQWADIKSAEADRRGFWIFPTKAALARSIEEYRRGSRTHVDVEALLGRGLN